MNDGCFEKTNQPPARPQQTQHQQYNQTNSSQQNQASSDFKLMDNIDINEIKDTNEIEMNQPPEFKLNLPFHLQQKDGKHIKSRVHIRGLLNDEHVYDVYRKIDGIDRKEKKMSPSWLSRQREEVAQGILIHAFRVPSQDVKAMSKSDALKLCFGKLKMLNAQKKIEVKKLMLFTDDEIKVIHWKMIARFKIKDLARELFDYFASHDDNLENEFFMDILDDCLVHKMYEDAICDIYIGMHKIMMKTKTANKFDSQFISFQQNRLNSKEFQKLLTIFNKLNDNPFRTYNINVKHITNIYIYSILDIYLKDLTCIVYELLEANSNIVINNNVTDEHAASFSGSGFCSMQRIAYSRALSPALRKTRIFLQKYLLCQESELEKVSKELQYRNMGGMYFMTPSLYPMFKRILAALATICNQHLVLPAVSLPDFTEIINSYINTQQNIEEFKALYPSKILSKYNEDISIIYERLLTFTCRKYIYAKLKQADFGEVGLGLRDQFNFGHMQYTKKK
eukprot:428729_1